MSEVYHDVDTDVDVDDNVNLRIVTLENNSSSSCMYVIYLQIVIIPIIVCRSKLFPLLLRVRVWQGRSEIVYYNFEFPSLF